LEVYIPFVLISFLVDSSFAGYFNSNHIGT
jgi:hypothetical protein